MPALNQVKLLYPIIDGQVTGGNVVCLYLIDEALGRGWDVVVTSPADGPLCDAIRQKGVPVFHIDTRRSFNLGAAVRIARLVRDQRVSLVHAHESFSGTMLVRLGARLAGVPVITHAHVRDPLSGNRLVRAYQLALNRWTSRACCSAVIAVSERVKEEFIEQGTDPCKVRVVYNGIDAMTWQIADRQRAREELRIPRGSPVIAHIGRLCGTKGQYLLIEAAQTVGLQHDEAIFLLVGEDLEQSGAYRRDLEGLARELKVDHMVRFLGYRGDVRQVLAAADVLALPSSAEGLPIVILEAMAAERPVVATPVGGVPELVSHEETGLLVPVGDVEALAEAILRLIGDPDAAHRMGQRGLERVRSRFDLRQMVEATFDIYGDVLVSRSDRAEDLKDAS